MLHVEQCVWVKGTYLTAVVCPHMTLLETGVQCLDHAVYILLPLISSCARVLLIALHSGLNRPDLSSLSLHVEANVMTNELV